MNLHAVANAAITAINPNVPLIVQVSTGYSTGSDGVRTPSYAPRVTVMGQVQPIQYKDLLMTDGLNLQGTRRSIYINGQVDGLVRSENKGGDLITDPSGNVYLVAMVAEAWPDWTRAICTLQDGA